MKKQQPTDGADDELTQAERIRRLIHRCDMEAEHVAELKEQVRASADQCRAQHQEIEKLRGMLEVQDEMVKHYVSERDEARRWFCQRAEWLDGGDGTQTAKEHGWDCFKDQPNG